MHPEIVEQRYGVISNKKGKVIHTHIKNKKQLPGSIFIGVRSIEIFKYHKI
jgi:hypothetical protein